MSELKRGDRPLSGRVFAAFLSFAAACALVAFVGFSIYDSDMYFMIATGREILANGIPYENVWHMEPGYGFVAQQWLYDVILALVDRLGPIGFMGFVVLEYLALAWLTYRIFRKADMSPGISILFLAVISLFFREYTFSIRPQTLTMILLLLTAVSLEQYCETSNWLYLIALPVLTCLEINLHGAMWPFHFCIVAAYAIPLPFPKGQRMDEARHMLRHLDHMGMSLLAMAASLLLNPYGIDGVAYVFRSYSGGVFSCLSVPEMKGAYVLSSAGLCLLLGAMLVIGCCKGKSLKCASLNMLLGFGLITAASRRNYMFLLVAFVFLFRDLHTGWAERIRAIDFRKSMTVSTIPALILLDVTALAMLAGTVGGNRIVDGGFAGTASQYDEAVAYIREDGGEDARIFTQFEMGSVLEYEGFTNVYMDNRSEIYMSNINGVHSTALDLSRCGIYGLTMSRKAIRTPSDYYPVTRDEMEAWLEYCRFDYICICPWHTAFLEGYLMNCPDYEIGHNSPGFVTVYRRVEN